MTTKQMIDEIRRANAQQSTGPKTTEGKQRSRMNAVKHNLSGQHLILQETEVVAFDRMARALFNDLNPKTEPERQIVQKICDTNFRLNRLAAIENNLICFGQVESETDVAEDDRIVVMRAQCAAWELKGNVFDNIGRYESRLIRNLKTYHAELRLLIADREAREQAEKQRSDEENKANQFNPASFGDPDQQQPQKPGPWHVLNYLKPPESAQTTPPPDQKHEEPLAA